MNLEESRERTLETSKSPADVLPASLKIQRFYADRIRFPRLLAAAARAGRAQFAALGLSFPSNRQLVQCVLSFQRFRRLEEVVFQVRANAQRLFVAVALIQARAREFTQVLKATKTLQRTLRFVRGVWADPKNYCLTDRSFENVVQETYDRVHAYSLLLEAGFDRTCLRALAGRCRSTEECVCAGDAWVGAARVIQREQRRRRLRGVISLVISGVGNKKQ